MILDNATHIVREKLLAIQLPEGVTGASTKLYFPFDAELKNSRIKAIRIYPANTGSVPPVWLNGINVADEQVLQSYVLTIVNSDGNTILENNPLMDFVSIKNLDEEARNQYNFIYAPEKSYISVPNGAAWGSASMVIFVFSFVHKL